MNVMIRIQAIKFFYAARALNSATSSKQNTGKWITLTVIAHLYKSCEGGALIPAQWFLYRNIQCVTIKQVNLQTVEMKKPDILLTYVLDPQVLTSSISPHISPTS